jgi:hypothetical protein
MPLKWKVIQVVDLLEGFLDVTLSEGSLATSERSSNIFGRKVSFTATSWISSRARPAAAAAALIRALIACNPDRT